MDSLNISSNQPTFANVEIKVPVRHEELDLDSLSEWELARMTSKTWSMEQD